MELEQGVMQVRLEDIIPNRFQPRINFDDKALNELAESIRQHGIIQPLVLRRLGDKYEIIAGERRYKAASLIGLPTVPAVLANIDDNASAEVALIENIQRKDLSAIEEAISYKNILDKGFLTQDQLATKLGISQSAISNKLRLLSLDQEVQDALMGEKISERHARALLQISELEEQKKWLQKIIRERMTVRQLDLELKRLKSGGEEGNDVPLVNLTPDIEEIKNQATDIHPIEEPKIMEDIFGNQQETEDAEETAIVSGGEQPRKFFNFLEDEEANLSVEEEKPMDSTFNFTSPIDQTTEIINTNPNEESVVLPSATINDINPIPSPLQTNNELPAQPTNVFQQIETSLPTMPEQMPSTTVQNQPTEVLDFGVPSITPLFPDTPSQNIDTDPSNTFIAPMEPQIPDPIILEQPLEPILSTPINNFGLETPVETVLPQNIEQNAPIMTPTEPENLPEIEQQDINYNPPKDINIVDPVNFINTLDPNFEKQMEQAAGLDLNSIISEIRNKVNDIESRGFKTDIEEVNFENSYQITIKIEKE